ncbi:MAG: hypothetical protein H6581_21270 [Bacteroidia bacterium]|nr:hypothetical protein [Bacteroidia bacterium]
MEKSKLAARLQSLSGKEFKAFSLFVNSPYFSQHQETIDFFRVIEPHFPHFKITDEEVCHQLNPQNPPDLPRLRVLRTYLTALLDDFLGEQKYRRNDSLRRELTVQALTEKGLYKEALKLVSLQKQDSGALAPVDIQENYVEHRMWIALLDLRLRNGDRMADLHIQELLLSLDSYYWATRLKYLCTLVSQGSLFSIEMPEGLISTTLELYARFGGEEMPLAAIYFHLLNLLLGESHALHYQQLRQLVDQFGGRIGRDEQVNFFGFLQNYLTSRYQRGEAGALREMFELYKLMLKQEILFGRGDFSTHSFRNISVIGARLGEFEWVESFIDENSHQLDPEMRSTMESYCRGYLAFSREEYGDALRLLQNVSFVDPFVRTGHQGLLLRIYYETRDPEPFYSLANTFRRFLNRNKDISETHRASSGNFISMVRKLMACRELEGAARMKEIRKIREEMAQAEFLTDRTWLNSKLDELSS